MSAPDLFVLEALFVILIFLLLLHRVLSIALFLRVVCSWSVCSGEL